MANGGKDKRGKEIRDEVRIYEMTANHTIETYFVSPIKSLLF